MVVYPLDRAKAAPFSTPLDKLTVVDLVRMTLGVGPCQYILDLEGQKRNSRGVATCYARDVINAIYKEGTQLQKRAEIEEQLDAAVAFISNVRERIDLYVKFGHEMSAYLEQQKRRDPRSAAFCDELLAITKRLDQMFEEKRESDPHPGIRPAVRGRLPAGAVDRDGKRRVSAVRGADGDVYVDRRGPGRAGRFLPDDRENAPAAGGNRPGGESRVERGGRRDPCPHPGDAAESDTL